MRLAVLGATLSAAAALHGGEGSAARVGAAHLLGDPDSCAACHPAEFDAWRGSHHARAEEPLAAADPARPEPFAQAVRWIGVAPLRQVLVPGPGGRLQVSDRAWDPVKGEWFGVFGAEAREPGEWGHWTGRGMNWNSQCAGCHDTQVAKAYDAGADGYATAVGHLGVTCAACHRTAATKALAPPEETCAACHARRTELTGAFLPGDRFDDHFAALIVDETPTFRADGRASEEDFEYAAFLGSAMHQAGVTCTDCHDPHSGGRRAQGDLLCLRCHGGANPKAPVVSPEAHAHHKPGSPGGACVDCHMPQTTFMQRHARRDHAFTVPDAALTRLTGEPNACGGCHRDKDVAWAEKAEAAWYGRAMDRPARARALAVAGARAGRPDVAALTSILGADRNPYWRAVAAGLLAPAAAGAPARAALGRALADPEPRVRAAAVRALGEAGVGGLAQAAGPLLGDSSRLVRLEAAWALRDCVDERQGAGAELAASLALGQDQPAGAYRLGVFEMGRHPGDALRQFERAVAWDPLAAPFREALAFAYSGAGRRPEAAEQLAQACRLAPADGRLRFQLGLARAEAGDLAGAEEALRRSVELDPSLAQAWYNLAVIAYQRGDRAQALRCARRALAMDASLARAAELLRLLGER